MDKPRVIKRIKIPTGRKQLVITVPQYLVDGIQARGVEYVRVSVFGDVLIVEPDEVET